MSEMVLDVRLTSKIDTYANWMSKNPVLKDGEIAVVRIPAETGAVTQEPNILIKVGDGTSTFDKLGFIAAKAGDVHDWAKAADKPSYKASEIEDLSDYISGKVQDTNTEYSFSIEDNYKIKVQKKEVNGEYADYQTLDLTSAFAAKADKVVGAVSGNFAGLDANGNLVDSGKKAADFEVAGAAAQALTDAKAHVTQREAAIGEAYAAADETNLATAKSYTDEQLNAHKADAVLHTTQAEHDKLAGIEEGAQANVIEKIKLNGEELAVGAGKVVDLGSIATSEALGGLQERVTEVEGKAATLIGNDAGKSARTIANEELAKQLIPKNAAESLNELQEIAAWIQAHPGDASAMNAAIQALQGKVDTGDQTVSAYVTAAIAALNIGDYATAANLSALAGRVEALEADTHTHANKTIIDGITQEKVNAWDAAQANVLENVSGVEGSIADKTFTVSGVSTDLLKQGTNVIVFNCGTASTVI